MNRRDNDNLNIATALAELLRMNVVEAETFVSLWGDDAVDDALENLRESFIPAVGLAAICYRERRRLEGEQVAAIEAERNFRQLRSTADLICRPTVPERQIGPKVYKEPLSRRV